MVTSRTVRFVPSCSGEIELVGLVKQTNATYFFPTRAPLESAFGPYFWMRSAGLAFDTVLDLEAFAPNFHVTSAGLAFDTVLDLEAFGPNSQLTSVGLAIERV